MEDDAITDHLDALVLFVVANEHALIAEVVAKGIDNLVIEEREQLLAAVDEVHLDAEVAEDRRVLAADHARAIDGHGVRCVIELEDRVAVADPRIREVQLGGPVGA